jgi:hypothetical protein
MPVFAITWLTTWSTSTTPAPGVQNVTNTDTGGNQSSGFGQVTGDQNSVYFTLNTIGNPTQITLTRDFLPDGGNPQMSAKMLLNQTGLSLQGSAAMSLEIWTTVSGQTTPKNEIVSAPGGGQLTVTGGGAVSDQFGTGPNNLSSDGTQYTIHIQFSLTSPGGSNNWSMSSTPTVITKLSDSP